MFISVEGGEGVGKTTQIAAIRRWLERNGHAVVETREPGGSALGEAIRDVVKDNAQSVPPLSELLLMFAARASHVEAVIEPALAAGKTVLCDRFTDASYAYQGGGRGLAVEKIETLQSWLPETAQPDVTILLDAPIELGLARARLRGEADRFEVEENAFFRRVREAYLDRARQNPQRFIVVDVAGKSVEAVTAAVLESLAQRLAGGIHD